jgi:hypothetical protein
MKLRQFSLAILLLGVLVGVAYVGQVAEPAGARMTNAAQAYVEKLTPEQKAKGTFAYDDKERTNWFFTPQQDAQRKPTRKGLPLAEMDEAQRKAALAMVAAGTSTEGDKKAVTIMSLESILRDLEKGGRMVRDPEWYFFTIFGAPSKTGKWGWRVEGHHLSLNFTLDGGQVVSATPCFFGANPATVLNGPRKGLRTLPEAEDLAKELFQSLDDDQKNVAHQGKQFEEIQEKTTAPKLGEPVGLATAKMNEKQRGLLWKVVESYATRMPPDIAEQQLSDVKKAGLESVTFAYAGGTAPREEYSYRIQGPTFVVEFLNRQADSAGNKANHIHSAWRNLKGDFGLAAP